jgi:alcohol dehydrogenase class IV
VGRGKVADLPALVGGLGRRAMVVLGGAGRGQAELEAGLRGAGVSVAEVIGVDREPTTHLVDEATERARAAGCDVVVAQGGGSAIDAGKAIAGMLRNPGSVLDYLEIVGAGRPLSEPGAPFVAVPTTAGTGAEATRNAVLDVPERQVKVSLRSPHLLARVVVVDPLLTVSVPPAVTACTGMDALTQLIEPLVSHAANPATDGLCREGLTRVARGLLPAFRDGQDLEAREAMSTAALFSGIALANARLGAVHGLAGVLGGLTGQAHGAICARFLPFVMEANLRAVAERGRGETLERFDQIARILTGDPTARAEDGVAWVREACVRMAIPGLGQAGLTADLLDPVITQAQRASSMQGNPVVLNEPELRGILEAAL